MRMAKAAARHVALLLLAVLMARPAEAGPIVSNTFLEFGFTDASVPATGCDPADPAGAFCVPSSGTPTVFLDAPPWTFVSPAAGADLTVTDAFESGDRFQVFDFGSSLGFTSLPAAGGDCGDDPLVCLADPTMSKAIFALGAGPHAITLTPVQSPSGGGVGYLEVSAAVAAVSAPASLVLLGGGLLGGWAVAIRPRRRHWTRP
jgi:hypothetical protein